MLTDRIQAEAVHRLLYTDLPTDDIRPESFRDPWKTLYFLASDALKYEDDPNAILSNVISRVPMDATDDYWTRVQEISQLIWHAGKPASHRSYADIDLPPVEWLWLNWIPRGMLSLLGAFQGTGKSWMALDMARIVTQGLAWPDGAPVDRHGPAIYVEAENVPRLTKARIAEMGIQARGIYPVIPDDHGILNLNSPVWQERLADMAADLKPELIIIDSLTSISDTGQNSVEDVNRLLMYLVSLADFANCGMLLIHHLRKPSSGQLSIPGVSIHDFRGSSHITAMARTALGLSVMQTGKGFSLNGPRRLDLVKTNLGPYPDPLGVRIVEQNGHKQFEYGEAPSADATARDDCGDWLLDLLEEGPMKVKDIIAAGEAEGFSRAMIYRARKENDQIVNTKGHRHPQNRWALLGWSEENDTE